MRAFIFFSALMASVSLSMAANGRTIGPASYDTGLVVHNTGFGKDGIYSTSNDGAGVVGTSSNGYGVKGFVNGYGYAINGEGGSIGTGILASGINGAEILGYNTIGGDATGIFTEAELGSLVAGSGDVHAVTAYGHEGYSNYGVEGYADHGVYNYGLLGRAYAPDGYETGNQSYGVHGEALGGEYTSTYGVYGTASGGTGSFIAAGWFNGDLWYGAGYSYSDRMFKKNIRDYEGGIKTVMALKPRLYEMRTDEFKGKMNLPKGTQIGLVAQEVAIVLPEIVKEGVAPGSWGNESIQSRLKKGEKKRTPSEPTRFKGVNYVELIPVMLKAIQEQQAQIEAQAVEIAALKRGK